MSDAKAPAKAPAATPAGPPLLTAPVPEAFQALINRVERDVVPWLPREAGYPATVYGTLTLVTEVQDPIFDVDKPPTTHTLLILDPPGESFSWGVHCLHRALRREIAAAIVDGALQIGFLVAVSYRGTSKKSRPGQQPAEIYRLTAASPDGQPVQHAIESTDEESEEESF